METDDTADILASLICGETLLGEFLAGVRDSEVRPVLLGRGDSKTPVPLRTDVFFLMDKGSTEEGGAAVLWMLPLGVESSAEWNV